MDSKLQRKIERLKSILSRYKSVLVAFSAGVDSTFLLKVAAGILPGGVLAVTAKSPTYPKRELRQARQLAKKLGVPIKIIHSQELKNIKFRNNPINRCYYCKEELFNKLRQLAVKEKIKFVLDGSNVDDKVDFRPGQIAKRKFKVRSPLAEAGLTKKDIRRASRHLKLETWDKPAFACLASRFSYGHKIDTRALSRIEKGEDFLQRLGFRQVRLRHYNGLVRIEVERKRIKDLVKPRVLNKVTNRLKKLGYNYVTVDLEGYRTGSMNIGTKVGTATLF